MIRKLSDLHGIFIPMLWNCGSFFRAAAVPALQ